MTDSNSFPFDSKKTQLDVFRYQKNTFNDYQYSAKQYDQRTDMCLTFAILDVLHLSKATFVDL